MVLGKSGRFLESFFLQSTFFAQPSAARLLKAATMRTHQKECDSIEMDRAKRRRLDAQDLRTVLFDACQSRDSFQEIFEGVNTAQVQNSWLLDVRPIYSSDEASVAAYERQDLSPTITFLTEQLLHVKRKLWPAAAQCAMAFQEITGQRSSPHAEFSEARRWCNPMESLGEGKARGLNQTFMNRAAIKLANIDAMLDFRLTQKPSSAPFLFVDLCGAPGGFSEYLMMRSQEFHHWDTQGTTPGSCRGYGMSLLGANEHGSGTAWKLDHISNWNYDGSFHTEYKISSGVDGTGDIYKWENVKQLGMEVQVDLQACGMQQNAKVHLVVADGGFDAQRDSECQEGLSQKLVLSEMAAGIQLLDTGGTFLVKMFGFQSPTIRTAMQSMSGMFESIQVLKPISSRPASSERYVIFQGFRGIPADIENGASWLGKVLFGSAAVGHLAQYTTLNAYMDQMDVDMLSLNLKACLAILSSLDRKVAAMHTGTDTNYSWNEERLPVNAAYYKRAWRL
jgi:cap1 methyltransferase